MGLHKRSAIYIIVLNHWNSRCLDGGDDLPRLSAMRTVAGIFLAAVRPMPLRIATGRGDQKGETLSERLVPALVSYFFASSASRNSIMFVTVV